MEKGLNSYLYINTFILNLCSNEAFKMVAFCTKLIYKNCNLREKCVIN